MQTTLANAERFTEVHRRVRDNARQYLPDRLVHLSDLRLTPDGNLTGPDLPELQLNSWSKKQLAQSLGVRWDKWFGAVVSGAERAEETNRRLSRLPGEVKLRMRQPFGPDSFTILRAMLPPSLTPIDDLRIFDQLAETFGPRLDAYYFTRVEIGDATSIYAAVHAEMRKVGDDEHFPGWLLRNSDVGASALSLDDHWLRLACMNGLLVSVGGKRTLYRTHRRIDDDQLTAALAVAMKNLPGRWKQAEALMARAKDVPVPHPDAAVATVLEPASIPRDLVAEAQTVALRDGDHTRFGVVQAITFVAHDGGNQPEVRFVMERLAGDYLAATPLAA